MWLRAQSIASALTLLLQGLLKEMATLPAGVALAGNKTVCKDTVKGFYRQALRLKPKVHVLVNAYHCVQLDSIITCCAYEAFVCACSLAPPCCPAPARGACA